MSFNAISHSRLFFGSRFPKPVNKRLPDICIFSSRIAAVMQLHVFTVYESRNLAGGVLVSFLKYSNPTAGGKNCLADNHAKALEGLDCQLPILSFIHFPQIVSNQLVW